MKISEEIDLRNFKFWGGAKERVKILDALDMYWMVEQMFEDAYPEGISRTEVNDYVWFQLQDDIRDGFYGQDIKGKYEDLF